MSRSNGNGHAPRSRDPKIRIAIVARERVEAFIRGEDNETSLGTEPPTKRRTRPLAPGHRTVVAQSEPATRTKASSDR
jgi:hypothetical protein